MKPWLDDVGRASFWRQFGQADESYTAELEALFSKVRCLMRILWGDRDPWIPIERGRELHRLMPSTFAALSGLGHLPQLESPKHVVERFLARS